MLERLGRPDYARLAPIARATPPSGNRAASSSSRRRPSSGRRQSGGSTPTPAPAPADHRVGLRLPSARAGACSSRRLLDASDTESAFDSELALLCWPTATPPARWIETRCTTAPPRGRPGPPVLMVTRLDGPDEKSVHDLIETSVAVEQELEGLAGNSWCSTPGQAGRRPLPRATTRRSATSADLLRDHTGLNSRWTTPAGCSTALAGQGHGPLLRLVQPAQLRRRAATSTPARSGSTSPALELVSLHDPTRPGWVHGLMGDGVVAHPRPGGRALPPVVPPRRRVLPAAVDREADAGGGVLEDHPDGELDAGAASATRCTRRTRRTPR